MNKYYLALLCLFFALHSVAGGLFSDDNMETNCEVCRSIASTNLFPQNQSNHALFQNINYFTGSMPVAISRTSGSTAAPIGVISSDLTNGWGGGFMISPCHVLTAQHVAFGSDGKRISNMFFYHGKGKVDSFEGKVTLEPVNLNERNTRTQKGFSDNRDVTVYRLNPCLDGYPYITLDPLPLGDALQTNFLTAGTPSFVYQDPSDGHSQKVSNPIKGTYESYGLGNVRIITEYMKGGDWMTFSTFSPGNSGDGLFFQKNGEIHAAGICLGARHDYGDKIIISTEPELANFVMPVSRIYEPVMTEVNADLVRLGRPPIPIIKYPKPQNSMQTAQLFN